MKKAVWAVCLISILALSGCQTKESNHTEQPLATGEERKEEGKEDSALLINQSSDLTEYITLGAYRGVEVQKIVPDPVTKKEVQEEIARVLQSYGKRLESDSQVVHDQDFVGISFQGYCGAELVEEAFAENLSLQVGSGTMVPGFEKQLIGMKKGETATVAVSIPEEDASSYAGKRMEYQVTVLDVYQMEVPALTKQTARKYFSCPSVDKVYQVVRKKLNKQAKRDAEDAMGNEAFQTALEQAVVHEYPEEYLKEFEEQIRQGMETNVTARGLSWQEYLSESGYTQEQMEEQIKQDAKQYLATEMFYQAVIKEEGMTLTEKEFQDGVKEFVDGDTYSSAEEVLQAADRERLEQKILYKKAYQLIADSAVPKK